MTNKIQITLIQIDNYGPWTMELGNDREYRLQMLQSSLYSDLQKHISNRNGIVFYNRFDEILAITNGIGLPEHASIQEEILSKYPFTISMSVGRGNTPYEAQHMASVVLQHAGSAQSNKRKSLLLGTPQDFPGDRVQMVHIDVDYATQKYVDVISAFETTMMMRKISVALGEQFLKKKALTFYFGGDNFAAVANGVRADSIEKILENTGRGLHLSLKGGVGIAMRARKAMELATANLDKIREERTNGPTRKLMKSTER
tara:strand:+ start:12178 stop:12951 length:774 start_codon:yes stop_codon:yes gene_type:complete